jgi:excisionase family DNA binding protein
MERNGVCFLTIDKTAEMLGFSTYTIRQWVKQDKIPYVTVGNKYMIDVEKTLEALRSGRFKG